VLRTADATVLRTATATVLRTADATVLCLRHPTGNRTAVPV